jgi:hypothetical protein
MFTRNDGRYLMDWDVLFCDVDDFCLEFEPQFQQRLLASNTRSRSRDGKLSLSEIMTIVVAFQMSHYRDFKAFYNNLRETGLDLFPDLVSYQRFNSLTSRLIVPLVGYLKSRFGTCSGISFVDSTHLAVCGNKRIERNRVFEGLAARGRSTIGWFYGFKLHVVINDCGELLGIQLTPGNVDDRRPVPTMTRSLTGKLYGDKGYISQALFEDLFDRGLQLVTTIRKNMKPRIVLLWDKLMLRKRSLIETVNDQLKNICQVDHTRHRSVNGFIVNLLAGLIAYTHQPKKPSIRWDENEKQQLAIIP